MALRWIWLMTMAAAAAAICTALPRSVLPAWARVEVYSALLRPTLRCVRGSPSSIRECFANQKTLAGAVEMYELDNGTSLLPRHGCECPGRTLSGRPVTLLRFPEAVSSKLVSDGYLQTLPRDPGGASGSFENYLLMDRSPAIFCLEHGHIPESTDPDPARSPRSQLIALGLDGGELFERASPVPLNERSWHPSVEVPAELLVWAAVLILVTIRHAAVYLPHMRALVPFAWGSLLMPAADLALTGELRGGATWLVLMVAVATALLVARLLYFAAATECRPSFVPILLVTRRGAVLEAGGGVLICSRDGLARAVRGQRRRLEAASIVAPSAAIAALMLLGVAGGVTLQAVLWCGALGLLAAVAGTWHRLAAPGELILGDTRQSFAMQVAAALFLGMFLGGMSPDRPGVFALVSIYLAVRNAADTLLCRWWLAEALASEAARVAGIASTAVSSELALARPPVRPQPAQAPLAAPGGSVATSGTLPGLRLATVNLVLGPSASCRVCGDGLERDVVLCRECRTPHHLACWHYNGGCAVFACDSKHPATLPRCARAAGG